MKCHITAARWRLDLIGIGGGKWLMKMMGALTAALTGSEHLPPPKSPQVSVAMHELIEEFLNISSVEQMCPAWCRLPVPVAQLALVIAVGTTSPERAFSAVSLPVIKTPLRNRMAPPMLDALMRIKLLTSCGLEQTAISIRLPVLKECAWDVDMPVGSSCCAH